MCGTGRCIQYLIIYQIFNYRYTGQLSFEQCFILFSRFPLLLAFDVGGLGFEFCVFVAGWRHALRSEWPFIIIIITHSEKLQPLNGVHAKLKAVAGVPQCGA